MKPTKAAAQAKFISTFFDSEQEYTFWKIKYAPEIPDEYLGLIVITTDGESREEKPSLFRYASNDAWSAEWQPEKGKSRPRKLGPSSVEKLAYCTHTHEEFWVGGRNMGPAKNQLYFKGRKFIPGWDDVSYETKKIASLFRSYSVLADALHANASKLSHEEFNAVLKDMATIHFDMMQLCIANTRNNNWDEPEATYEKMKAFMY